jgi:ankyrin repeat protein
MPTHIPIPFILMRTTTITNELGDIYSYINREYTDIEDTILREFILSCRTGLKMCVKHHLIETVIPGGIYAMQHGLLNAAYYGQLHIVKYLCGFDFSLGDTYYYEAFRFACMNGHLDIVKYFVETKNVNIHIEYEGALSDTIYNQEKEVATYLIEHGANIHIVDEDDEARLTIGEDLLCCFAEKGDLEWFSFILSLGVDPQCNDNQCFRYCVIENHMDIIKHLVIDWDYNPHFDDYYALRLSIVKCRFEIARFLLSCIPTNINHAVPRLFMSVLEHSTVIDSIEFMIDADITPKIDIHINNEEPLYWSVSCGRFEYVKLLIESGADYRVDDDILLQHAAENGYVDIFTYLLEQGCSLTRFSNDVLGRLDDQEIIDILASEYGLVYNPNIVVFNPAPDGFEARTQDRNVWICSITFDALKQEQSQQPSQQQTQPQSQQQSQQQTRQFNKKELVDACSNCRNTFKHSALCKWLKTNVSCPFRCPLPCTFYTLTECVVVETES